MGFVVYIGPSEANKDLKTETIVLLLSQFIIILNLDACKYF